MFSVVVLVVTFAVVGECLQRSEKEYDGTNDAGVVVVVGVEEDVNG